MLRSNSFFVKLHCLVSEAGIIILPPPQEMDEVDCQENGQVLGAESHSQNWPTKPGLPNYNLFDSEDSWYDSPPEEFNLSVSCLSNHYLYLCCILSFSLYSCSSTLGMIL